MPDPASVPFKEDPKHIEPIGFLWPTVARNPNLCRPLQLPPLSPVHRLHGASEPRTRSGFDLNERHDPFALHDQVDIPAPRPKTPVYDPPSPLREPALSDSLPEFPECLRRR
jgi:hypothetical protein